jgi:hypothetical protein
MTKEIKGDAPTVRMGFELVFKFWESNGQVPAVGSKLEPWLRQTGTFSEANVHEAIATFDSQVSTGTHASGRPHPNVANAKARWPRLDAQEFVA